MSPEKEIRLRTIEVINAALDKFEFMLKENPEMVRLDHNHRDVDFQMNIGNNETLCFYWSNYSVTVFTLKGKQILSKATLDIKWPQFNKTYKRVRHVDGEISRYYKNKEQYDNLNKLSRVLVDVDKILLEDDNE